MFVNPVHHRNICLPNVHFLLSQRESFTQNCRVVKIQKHEIYGNLLTKNDNVGHLNTALFFQCKVGLLYHHALFHLLTHTRHICPQAP